MNDYNLSSTQFESVDDAFRIILSDLVNSGEKIPGGSSLSTGSERYTREILNYTFQVLNPQKRLLHRNFNRINLPGAVSRFVWMMGANDRIKDIEFYWGKGVGKFSDDEITMPGSNYGARMFTSRPGLDQVRSIIGRLRNNPHTRRATIAIYQPEDAVRKSRDIPCAFGLTFHIRNERLNTSVLMRSNNASFLLPYNVFEFSLLSEVVANEVGVLPGKMTYTAQSMHIYESDLLKVQESLSESRDLVDAYTLPVIPENSNPLDNIISLVKLEADLRHAAMGINHSNLQNWINKGEEALNSYWMQFYLILLYFILMEKLNNGKLARKIHKRILPPFTQYIDSLPEEDEINDGRDFYTDLFGQPILSSTQPLTSSIYISRLSSLDKQCSTISSEYLELGEKEISFDEYLLLKLHFIGLEENGIAIAARNLLPEIDKLEVREFLNDLRNS